ncbi:MAG TPA: hypothetical protein VIA45_12405 [Thermoanaerobaculia bacterium]|jgi:hypothetical protein
MRKQHKPAVSAWAAACALLAVGWTTSASLSAQPAEARPRVPWAQSPYRSFGPARAIASGAVLRDEADDPALRRALSERIARLADELFARDGWTSPFAPDDPVRFLVTRSEAGGVRRLSSRSVEAGKIAGPAIEIDGSDLDNDGIVREAARLFALAVISGYGVPDRSFVTEAAATYLADAGDSADLAAAAAAPSLVLGEHADSLGRLLIDEFARSAGGRTSVRLLFERARDLGEEPIVSLARTYTERTGLTEETLLARLGARLYAAPSAETDPVPSAIGLWDLAAGSLDAGVPGAWTLRHRSFAPPDGAAALRYRWPAGAGLGAAIVRYRDADLPPDVVFLEPDRVESIALSGVARVDWIVAGGSAPAGPVLPAFFEPLAGYPFAGLQPHAAASAEGARLWWTTASHEGLAGWAVFRAEVLADGRVVRTGPEIVPAAEDTPDAFRYAYVDTGSRPGTYYQYTVWAVTADGLLARAFSATLRTPE